MIIRMIILMTAFWAGLIYPLHGELSAELEGEVPQSRDSVLVLYPDEGEYADLGELHAVNIANLVGRHAEAALAAISEYEVEDRDAHEALVVVNASYDQPLPDALVEDVLSSEDETIWVQYGTEELEEAAAPSLAAQIGWLAESLTTEDFNGVVYRGEEFERQPESTHAVAEIRITDPERVEVLAELRAESGRTIPWAVRSDSLTYVTESPMNFASEDDRYLVFADILSRTLEPDLPETRQALLRIEDIGPEADPVQVRAMTEAIAGMGIPFSATIYDTFVDPHGHFSNGHAREFSLIDRPFLTGALRDMARAGGTLIMHGHTHQHGDLPNPHYGTSGGDYEFFRAGLDEDGRFDLLGPIEGESPALWNARLQTALGNWEAAGLPTPFAYTAPHYAASVDAYTALGANFPVRHERVLYFAGEARGQPDYDTQYNDQFFPYPVRDIRGDIILPETLGNWAQPGSIHGRTVDAMLASARRNLVLREAWAGFFYHWYLPPDELRLLVEGLEAMGYEFVSTQTAASVIPASSTLPGRPRRDVAVSRYQDEMDSWQFWLRDQVALIILALIIFAHLIVFRIGPRRRRLARS